MLESDEVDMVLVTTPSNTHARYAIQALNAGKHVVVDKPPATSLADLRKMFAAARKNSKKLVTFQNRRWDGDFMTVKRALAAGRIGEILYVETNVLGYSYGDYGFFKKWRLRKKYGGGMLLDWGSHLIDHMMQLIPSPVHSVWADLRGIVWTKEVDDHCMIILRFKNGVVARIFASGVICHPGYRWFVCGTKGVLSQAGPWGKPMLIRRPDGKGTKDSSVAEVKTNWIQFYRLVEKALNGKGELPVRPQESIRLLKVIEAARESARTSTTAKIRDW
jgi:predicted dehydrogenase